MVFWPWIQKSTKRWSSCILSDPEYSSWETFRIALGNEKYKFCLINLSLTHAKCHGTSDTNLSIKESHALLTSSITIHIDCSLPRKFVANNIVEIRIHSVAFFLQHDRPFISRAPNISYVPPCGCIRGSRNESQQPQWVVCCRPCDTAEKQQLVLQQLPSEMNLPGFL